MDLWEAWERDVQTEGRPDRVAAELSDEELVNLLAACPDHLLTSPATRALKQEALARLRRAPRPDRPPA